ncbi:MAG TPA: cell division protein FtsZ [Candidatus Paceibacterota bacterium]|jgi:cell division protein FtsZ|nr:cell division protein FtsZ [Candidatus Paceibacterota bacterium]HRU35937.1 cell division protein FtsZ [Candidatus Paceibacterota bacterium]
MNSKLKNKKIKKSSKNQKEEPKIIKSVSSKKINKKAKKTIEKSKISQEFLNYKEDFLNEEKNIAKQQKKEKQEMIKRLKAANKNIRNSILENFPNIKVIGVGGAGGNILSRMKQAKIEGVEFIVVNTDLQDLYKSGIKRKIHIGKNISRGMGSGMNPEVGRQAAEESREQLEEAIKGADMVFLACGLGGGTGSGATPVIADICQQLGVLTIAIVTKPFAFEGSKRAQIAEEALLKLKEKVDAYIVIPNDRIFNVIEEKTPLSQAFEMIDEILKQSVKGISDLILMPGIINVDFSDVKAILQDAGMSLIGLAKATGEDRAIKAAKEALGSPLFEYSPHMARGILFNIIGDSSLTMTEINEAARVITEVVDPTAKIIFGAMEDEKNKKGEIKIMVIAAGFEYSSKNSNRAQSSSYTPLEKLNKKPFESTSSNLNDYNKDSIQTISIDEHSMEDFTDHSIDEIPAFLRKRKNK